MFAEDELAPISALQHLLFCERQCALIHIERLWEENALTADGRHMHERSDEETAETRDGVRISRSLPLRSLKWGLCGKADVVEFIPDPLGVTVPGLSGKYRLLPVEYKRGRPKSDASDRTQLCAQALCLEEMFATDISSGALFYGRPRRRLEVGFDASLRESTISVIAKLHQLLLSGRTPPAIADSRCTSCSLVHTCLPQCTQKGRSVARFMAAALRNMKNT